MWSIWLIAQVLNMDHNRVNMVQYGSHYVKFSVFCGSIRHTIAWKDGIDENSAHLQDESRLEAYFPDQCD